MEYCLIGPRMSGFPGDLIFLATHLYVKIIRQSNRGTGIWPIIYLWLTSRAMYYKYGLHCLLWRIANLVSIHPPMWMSYLTNHLLLRYLSTEVRTLPPLTNQQRIARMAYSSSGRSNDDLVKQLTANGLITSERIAEVRPAAQIRRSLLTFHSGKAFRSVDRKNYVLDQRDAYYDTPQYVNGHFRFGHVWGRKTHLLN